MRHTRLQAHNGTLFGKPVRSPLIFRTGPGEHGTQAASLHKCSNEIETGADPVQIEWRAPELSRLCIPSKMKEMRGPCRLHC